MNRLSRPVQNNLECSFGDGPCIIAETQPANSEGFRSDYTSTQFNDEGALVHLDGLRGERVREEAKYDDAPSGHTQSGVAESARMAGN